MSSSKSTEMLDNKLVSQKWYFMKGKLRACTCLIVVNFPPKYTDKSIVLYL